MEENEFSEIIELITQRTGIIPRDSHKTGIRNYINKRLESLETTSGVIPDGPGEYYKYLLLNQDELINLINSSTVNETYFFREEAQFQLLHSKIFPEISSKKNGRINIWSAASSSGEEIYSLYLLAQSMGIHAECIASDINTNVLDNCRKGVYRKSAVRTVDGAKYQYLLTSFKKNDGTFEIPEYIRNKIDFKRINLSKCLDFPKNQDVIFIRNVFIYFSNEMKKKVIDKLVNESLNEDGYLFVSMNEVASLDATLLPSSLEKLADGKIFYFHKKKEMP